MSFITCLWLLTLFYSWEHRVFCAHLRAAHKTLGQTPQALHKLDLRIVEQDGKRIVLRRAFHIGTAQDFLRYAVPIAMVAALMIVWQNWLLAALYGICVAAKWFAVEGVIIPHGAHQRFEARLFGLRLFGEDL